MVYFKKGYNFYSCKCKGDFKRFFFLRKKANLSSVTFNFFNFFLLMGKSGLHQHNTEECYVENML